VTTEEEKAVKPVTVAEIGIQDNGFIEWIARHPSKQPLIETIIFPKTVEVGDGETLTVHNTNGVVTGMWLKRKGKRRVRIYPEKVKKGGE
jgi:endonuclease YncB( thermonuclease family)